MRIHDEQISLEEEEREGRKGGREEGRKEGRNERNERKKGMRGYKNKIPTSSTLMFNKAFSSSSVSSLFGLSIMCELPFKTAAISSSRGVLG